MEELKEAFARFGTALRDCAAAFGKLFRQWCDALQPAIQIYAMPNSRVKHLALHGRKARTRKKNMKRLLKGGAGNA